jgi:fructose-bisphosphate aldolase class I
VKTFLEKQENHMSDFIAAMDHSGGSTGGVLERYGQKYKESNKMELVHQMRLRMVNSPEFTSENIWAAILYKDTVERGMVPVLKDKGIEAYLKIDSGCEDNGYLKYFRWNEMTDFAKEHGCTGTKMRSIVKSDKDLSMILDQQFALAEGIYNEGLMPIVEPEIPIEHPDKELYEYKLRDELAERLDALHGRCILKLTLPEQDDFYAGIIPHDRVERVVGLSGGYSTEEACRRLSRQRGMTASFSRGLSEGLFASQTDEEFNARITTNIHMIREAGNGV